MSYRPKNWENPYDLYMAGIVIRPNERAEDYEEGADRMFEELSKLPLEELMKIFAKHTDRYEPLVEE